MSILDRNLFVEMPDGSVWAVPVLVIAENRAEYYKDNFGGDVDRSMKEDTGPLFSYDFYAIEDWASSEMNWEDVKEFAVKVEESKYVDYQDGWVNGDKEVR